MNACVKCGNVDALAGHDVCSDCIDTDVLSFRREMAQALTVSAERWGVENAAEEAAAFFAEVAAV